MKKQCVICSKARGKCACKLHDNELVCPICCATNRDQECEGCRHYTFAQEYQAAKYHDSGTKDFIIEVNEKVEKSIDRALELIERHAFQEGKAIIQNLMVAHPRNHTVHFAMGVYYAFQEDYDPALEYFDNATKIFPYFTDAYFNKAVVYQKKLDIRNMIKAFQKVVEIGDPQDEYVRQAKGNLVKMEQQILQPDGLTFETYFKAMDLFEKRFDYMNKQDWEQALRYFKKCVMINKSHPQSYGNMGICYG